MGTLFRLKELLRIDQLTNEQYECLSCEATFEYQRQVCPECGGCDIRSLKWLGNADDSELSESGR